MKIYKFVLETKALTNKNFFKMECLSREECEIKETAKMYKMVDPEKYFVPSYSKQIPKDEIDKFHNHYSGLVLYTLDSDMKTAINKYIQYFKDVIIPKFEMRINEAEEMRAASVSDLEYLEQLIEECEE